MKTYGTGKCTWLFGSNYFYGDRESKNVLLGPCPECGGITVSQGDDGTEWWCREKCCLERNTLKEDYPSWWDTDINVYLDGKAWCATRDGFINLMESHAGFGDTPQEAVNRLLKVGE
jgi:hypothetical protein